MKPDPQATLTFEEDPAAQHLWNVIREMALERMATCEHEWLRREPGGIVLRICPKCGARSDVEPN